MSRSQLEKSGYLHSFPHLLGDVSCLEGDEAEVHALVETSGLDRVNCQRRSWFCRRPLATRCIRWRRPAGPYRRRASCSTSLPIVFVASPRTRWGGSNRSECASSFAWERPNRFWIFELDGCPGAAAGQSSRPSASRSLRPVTLLRKSRQVGCDEPTGTIVKV